MKTTELVSKLARAAGYVNMTIEDLMENRNGALRQVWAAQALLSEVAEEERKLSRRK